MSLLSRLDAALLRRHQRNTARAAVRNHQTPGHSAITTKGTTMARDERVGVASGTEPLAGTTGVAEAHRIAVRYWQREAKEARDTLVDFQIASHKALRDAGDEIARLRAIYIGRDKVVWRLRLERDDVRIRLAERDAQVTRLTKRLSEGLG